MSRDERSIEERIMYYVRLAEAHRQHSHTEGTLLGFPVVEVDEAEMQAGEAQERKASDP